MQATHQILIVEDEPAIRNVLHVLLGKEGYKLIEAETATRGEIEARSHKPDLHTHLLQLGALRIDFANRQTRGPQGDIHLTPVEYRLLECLARQAGMVVRQRQLLCEVWGPDRSEDARSLRVFMKSLRAKLEPDPRCPRYLVTETGLGYRLCANETALPTGSPGLWG